MTQYGLGTVEIGLVQSDAVFSTDFRNVAKITVTAVYFQDVVAFNTDYRPRNTYSVAITDVATFSDNFANDVIQPVWMLDNIAFTADIRLKYVPVNMADSIVFNSDVHSVVLLIARAEDTVQFSTVLAPPVIIKSVGMYDDIVFTTNFHARHHWQQLPNPYDEIWSPIASLGDVWIPVVDPQAEIWTPVVHVQDYWVPRVIPNDIWTPREQNNG
jgi:hypothetical protein